MSFEQPGMEFSVIRELVFGNEYKDSTPFVDNLWYFDSSHVLSVSVLSYVNHKFDTWKTHAIHPTICKFFWKQQKYHWDPIYVFLNHQSLPHNPSRTTITAGQFSSKKDRSIAHNDKSLSKQKEKLDSITKLPFSKLSNNDTLIYTPPYSMKPLFLKMGNTDISTKTTSTSLEIFALQDVIISTPQ